MKSNSNQHVLVFKTNIDSKAEVKKLTPVLNNKAILKWNLDLEDRDRVLRIVTNQLMPKEIIQAVQ
jgi:hypothetical protein